MGRSGTGDFPACGRFPHELRACRGGAPQDAVPPSPGVISPVTSAITASPVRCLFDEAWKCLFRAAAKSSIEAIIRAAGVASTRLMAVHAMALCLLPPANADAAIPVNFADHDGVCRECLSPREHGDSPGSCGTPPFATGRRADIDGAQRLRPAPALMPLQVNKS